MLPKLRSPSFRLPSPKPDLITHIPHTIYSVPFALRIALRYLFAPKSHNVVNVIAIIAVTGVAVAAAAMVVVLGVFNGFTDLAASHMSRLDPQIEVSRADGRVIADGDSLARALAGKDGVAAAVPVLSGRALAVGGSGQTAVVYKGVPEDYLSVANAEDVMIDGVYAHATDAGDAASQISVGVANTLLLRPGALNTLQLYVPRRLGRINPANPDAAFRRGVTVVSGVYQVDQPDLDADRIIVPLDVVRDMLDYDTEASAIELAVSPGADVNTVRDALRTALGDEYLVRDRFEQRVEAFRMIAVEKWVTFMMLIFVLLIALFNIVSTLSLLIIEKRDNIFTLRAMGATMRTVRAIFTLEAWLITLGGGVIGCLVGVALSLAQQYGHIIKLSGDAATLTIEAYPMRASLTDTLVVLAAVAATGLLTALTVRLLTRRSNLSDITVNRL